MEDLMVDKLVKDANHEPSLMVTTNDGFKQIAVPWLKMMVGDGSLMSTTYVIGHATVEWFY